MRPLAPSGLYRALSALTRRMAKPLILASLILTPLLPSPLTPSAYAAQWMDVATISNTLTNTAGKLCVGGGRTDIGCPTYAPGLTTGGIIIPVGISSTGPISGTEGYFAQRVSIGAPFPVSAPATLSLNVANTLQVQGASKSFVVTTTGFGVDFTSYNAPLYINNSSSNTIINGIGTGLVGVHVLEPSTTFHVGGTIEIANSGESCDTSRLGAIKYQTNAFYVCQSVANGWEAIGTTGATSLADRITSNSQAGVIANSTGYISLTTGGVTGTAYFTPNAVLVNGGISASGVISTTSNGYYGGAVQANGYVGGTFRGFSSGTGSPNAPIFSINNQSAGMYFPGSAANQMLAFSTSGTEAIRIVSSGFVGIGTTSPSSTLHIMAAPDSAAGGLTMGSTSNGTFRFQLVPSGGASSYLKLNNSGNFTVRDATSNPFVMFDPTSNKMGVGSNFSATPSTTLQVSGTIKIADGGEACDTSRIGAMKYTSGAFYICQNTTNGWEPLATSGATSLADRITSGSQAGVIANSTGYISLTTGGVTGTAYFTPAAVLVTGGVSTTGPISATYGYFSTYVQSGSYSGGYYRGNSTNGGTAANPVFSILGQSTGMYFPGSAADQALAFSTNSTEALRITSNSYVGIGLNGANPSTTLHVSGSITVNMPTSAAGGLTVKNGGMSTNLTHNQIYSSNTPLYLNYSSNWSTFINQGGGNVGIGIITATPSTTLQVSGAIRMAADTSTTMATCDTNRLGAIRYTGGSFSVCQNTTNGWEPLATTGATSLADRITSGSQAGVIANSTGYISLTTGGVTGTAYFTPAAVLVTGGVSTTGPISGTNGYFSNALQANSYINSSFFRLFSPNGGTAALPALSINAQIDTGLFFPGNASLAFSTSGTEAFRITSNSYVGIGTTTPANTLEVSGTIRVSNNSNYVYLNGLGLQSLNGMYINTDSNASNGTTWIGRVNTGTRVGIAMPSINPSTTLQVSGTIQVANGGETCDTNRLGAIKYTSPTFYVCQNTTSGWQSLASVASAAVSTTVTTGISGSLIFRDASGVLTASDTLSLMAPSATLAIGPQSSVPTYIGNNSLSVSNSIYAGGAYYLNPTGKMYWGNATTAIRAADNTSGSYFSIYTNANEAMRVTNNGSIGIGTTIPSDTLHISGTMRIGPTNTFNMLFNGTEIRPLNNGGGATLFLNTTNTAGNVNIGGIGGSRVAVAMSGVDPSTTLDVSGTLKLRDGAETCDTNRLGAIKYSAAQFYVCKNTTNGWEPLSTTTSSSTPSISTGLSGSIVYRDQSGYLQANNTFSISSTTGSIGIGAGAPVSVGNDGLFVSGSTTIGAAINAGGSFQFNTTAARYISWNGSGGVYMLGDPVAKSLAIGTSGTEALRITSNSNVGIGTTTPIAMLQVSGTAQLSGAYIGGNEIIGRNPATASYLPDFYVATSRADTMVRIGGTSGKVGIGMGGGIPNTTLDVAGTLKIANGAEACDINRLGAIRYVSGSTFQVCQSIANGWEPLSTSTSSTTPSISTGASGSIVYRDQYGYLYASSTLSISSTTGSVGIGAGPPASAGNNALYATGYVYGYGVTAYGSSFYATLGNGLQWAALGNAINSGNASGPNMTFLVSNSEAMRITSSSNVGIGTTAPSATLHVSGTIRISQDGTASYTYLTKNGISSNNPLYVNTDANASNATTWIGRSNGGNVGIAMPGIAPSSTLHIMGVSNTSGGLTIGSSETGTSRLAIYPTGSTSAAIKLPAGGGLSLAGGGSTAFANLNPLYGSIFSNGYNGDVASSPASTTLHIQGSVRLSAEVSTTLNTCDTNRLGAIRYTSGTFSICQSAATGWESLTTASSAAAGDRITSGTTQAITYNNTSISLVTSGTERMVIGTNGNVGIASQPVGSNVLTVSGSAAFKGSFLISTTDSSVPAFYVSATTGAIGLRTTNPGAVLDVRGGNFYVGDGTSIAYAPQYWALIDGNLGIMNNGSLEFNVGGTRTDINQYGVQRNSGSIGSFNFTNSGGMSVGINTDQPSTTLSVSGTLRIADAGETCDINRLGAMKYATAQFYVCRNTTNGWEPLSTSTSSSTPSISTGASGSIVYRDQFGYLLASNSLSISSTTGSVGIGAGAPVSLGNNGLYASGAITAGGALNAYSLAAVTNAYFNTGTGVQWPITGNAITSGIASGPAMSLSVSNSTAITIVSNGYVGIGTTAPSATLHVSGTIRASNGGSAYTDHTYNGLQKSDGIMFLNTNVAGGTTFITGAGGKVAIGTVIAPSTTLEVSGTLKIRDGGEACDTFRAGAIRYTSTSIFQGCNGTTWGTIDSATTLGASSSGDRITSGTTNVTANNNGAISFTTAGTQRMVIGSTGTAGQVGIGVAAPIANAALTVSGVTYIRGVLDLQTTGTSNTLIGTSAGTNLSGNASFQLTAMGTGALQNNSGTSVSAFGYQAGQNNASTFTTDLGAYAGQYNGQQNLTAAGYSAGQYNSGINSTMVGMNSGNSNSGSHLTAIGFLSGLGNTGGNATLLGAYAGQSNTGANVTAIGYSTAVNNTGSQVLAFGSYAAQGNTGNSIVAAGFSTLGKNSGSNNTAIGDSTALNNTSGYNGVAIGSQAMTNNETGGANTAVGFRAGYGVVSSSFNGATLIGTYSGLALTTGNSNTLIGYNSGYGITTGSSNIVIGANAGPFSNTGSNQLNIAGAIYGDTGRVLASKIGINVTSPTANLEVSGTISATAITIGGVPLTGSGAGASTFASLTDVTYSFTNGNLSGPAGLQSNTTVTTTTAFGIAALNSAGNIGAGNSAFGYATLSNNTSGYNNIAVGSGALNKNTTGYQNTAVGFTTLTNNTTGYSNIAMGGNALATNTSGYANLAMGPNALRLTTGNSNTVVGYNSGAGITTGSNNLILGSNLSPFSNTGDNQLNIGNSIFGDLGRSLATRIGINVTSPTANLEVSGTISATAITINGQPITGGSSGDRITSGTTSVIAYTNTSISLVTAGTERMVISAAGLVGIGQQPASPYLLAVSGTARVTGNLVLGTNSNVYIGNSITGGSTTQGNNIGLGYYTLQSNTGTSVVGIGANTARNNTGDYLIAMGANAADNNTGGHLIAIGEYAGANNIGNYSLALGYYAGQYNTAQYNTALGYQAGMYNQGNTSTAVGFSAMRFHSTGADNTALGAYAGNGVSNTSNFARNTLIGSYAGTALTTGSSNTIIGYNAGSGLTTGSGNLILGTNLSPFDNTGSNQLNIGNAIFGDIKDATTLLAAKIGINVTSPTANLEVSGTISATALTINGVPFTGGGAGASTFASLTDVSTSATAGNIYGPGSLTGAAAGTTGATAFGIGALANASNSGTNNTAFGNVALTGNTTGASNAAFGVNALRSNTTGSQNTALGQSALYSNSSGIGNIAIGMNAQLQNTTGNNNVAVGPSALYGNVTGLNNTAVGAGSLSSNKSFNNSGLGFNSLNLLAGGSDNAAFGVNAMQNAATGTGNVAMGSGALTSVIAVTNTTAVGYQSGFGTSSSSYQNGTYLGAYTGYAITTGGSNTLVGYNSGAGITTGANNLILGASLSPFSNTGSNQLNLAGAIFGDYGRPLAAKIGINVTSPTTALQVSGTISTNAAVQPGNTDTTCSTTADYGKMRFDATTAKLYLCRP